MSWIKTVSRQSASGKLARLYDSLTRSKDTLDDVLKVHSLRPATMAAHLSLYKSILHNPANTLPLWFLEVLGVRVSSLNGCEYCRVHHQRGLRAALLSDGEFGATKIDSLLSALDGEELKTLLGCALYGGTGVRFGSDAHSSEDATR